LHGQKSIWHAHDLSWHTPWQALAPHGLAMPHTKACRGRPWLALAPHGLAMAHTKACRGKPWHPMGKPLTSVGLAHGHAMASRGTHQGTHQGMPWAADGHATNLGLHCSWACQGKPWHMPRHAMAHVEPWNGTHQGKPWHTPRHVVARTKACHDKSWHTPRHATP